MASKKTDCAEPKLAKNHVRITVEEIFNFEPVEGDDGFEVVVTREDLYKRLNAVLDNYGEYEGVNVGTVLVRWSS